MPRWHLLEHGARVDGGPSLRAALSARADAVARSRLSAVLLASAAVLVIRSDGGLVLGAALVPLAWGASRRRRLVLYVGVPLTAAVAAWGLYEMDRARVLVGVLAGLSLLSAAGEGVLLGAPSRGRQRLAVRIGAAFIVAGAFVAVVVTVHGGHEAWSPRPRNRSVALETAARLVDASGPLVPLTRSTRAVDRGLPWVGAMAVLLGIGALVAPSEDVAADDLERALGRSLIAETEDDTLAPFAARSDKNLVFDPAGRAAVGYRVIGGVALAGGDPVGEAAARIAAFEAFRDRCNEAGWVPVVIGAGDVITNYARATGMRAIHFGDEALIDVGTFRLDQPAMRNVRQAVQRTRNAGVAVTICRDGDMDEALRAALAAIAREGLRGGKERGFSMILDGLVNGEFPDGIFIVCHRDGDPMAFQRYLRCGTSALTLDTMCRSRRAGNGVNERMISEMVGWAAERGIARVSLNFAAFRELFEWDGGPMIGVVRWLAHRLDVFINVESLNRFTAKFRPTWRPRYVLFRSMAELPHILPSALIAEFKGTRPDTVSRVPARL